MPLPPDVRYLPMNRDIVWYATGALYGYCPRCGSPGVRRSSLDGTGKDSCQANGHQYPSTEAQRTPSGAGNKPELIKPRRIKRG